jgi:hypothetical protein
MSELLRESEPAFPSKHRLHPVFLPECGERLLSNDVSLTLRMYHRYFEEGKGCSLKGRRGDINSVFLNRSH